MKTLSLACVKIILENHGLSIYEQTGILNGKTVDSNTSFAEQIGIKENYTKKEVYEWLGY
ncbi:MAG: hypothetical protein WC860_07030 [Candidatus Margulisiibacteriota bacterium]|jgi:hypothetical protein